MKDIVYVLSTSTEEGVLRPKVFDSEEKAQEELETLYYDCMRHSIYPIENSTLDEERHYFNIEYRDRHLYAYIYKVEVK